MVYEYPEYEENYYNNIRGKWIFKVCVNCGWSKEGKPMSVPKRCLAEDA